MPSDFLKSPQRNAFTFGLSRVAYEHVFVREHPPRDKAVPGPGAYPSRPVIAGSKWTMKGRHRMALISPLIEVKPLANQPGPGAYEPVRAISPEGKHFYSKFKDSTTSALRSAARRFADEHTLPPGPGHYQHPKPIDPTTRNLVSVYGSAPSRTFGFAKRGDPNGNTSIRFLMIQ